MRPGPLPLSVALLLAALVAPSPAQLLEKAVKGPAPKGADDKTPQVVLDTTMGQITLELDREKAPISVDNFLKYVDAHYYDGLVFHRVIPGFMIQGGGMEEVGGSLRPKKPMYPPIKNESRNGLKHVRGALAMARTGVVDSATSQFFIDHVNRPDLDAARGGYTVFGKVVDGLDVVDAIAKVKTTDRSQDEEAVPDKTVLIKSATRKAK